MKGIALDIGDQLMNTEGRGFVRTFGAGPLRQIDLVQVATAVVQVVQCPFGIGIIRQAGQNGLGAVAQFVVSMTQGVRLTADFVRTVLGDQVAKQVIFEAGGVEKL